jgi:uncharacterized integral membrane protein
MNSRGEMSRAERRARADQTVRVIVWLAVLAAVVIFAAVNRDDVAVDWVIDETEAPLWIVIGASALGGALIGFVSRPRRR